MEGSIPRKLARLALNLSANPRYAVRYLRELRASPLQLGLPWFSYAAIEFLERWVDRSKEVFEYGSGGSSVFFGARARQVLSVEDDARWLERTRAVLAASGLDNVRLMHAPFDPRDRMGFSSSAYLEALNESYDVIVIDGTEDWPDHVVRPICFGRAQDHIRPGGVIVVDDSWRYEALRRSSRARRVQIFKSVGPARPGVTTTDIHFY